VAQASKYLITWRRKHIFNPAAVAVVLSGAVGWVPATWWIATAVMAPFTLALGLLVVRKIRRAAMVGVFALAAVVLILSIGLAHGEPLEDLLVASITTWPLVFFGTIMLTEPATMPPRRYQQLIYAGVVGLMFASQFHLAGVIATPEIALVMGNLYAFAVSPHYRLRLKLKRINRLSPRVADLVFESDRHPQHLPGQYLEVTLAHPKPDLRGNRRTFTIASSPTEPELHLGVKFYEPSSTFKLALQRMKPGDIVVADQLAGSFILPRDPAQKLVMVAGGIGVTPFRSMIKYLIDTNQRRDIVLLYAISDPDELSYADIIAQAEPLGVRMVPILGSPNPSSSWKGRTGFVDAALIQTEIPDYHERRFYLSGPQIMVDKARRSLRSINVRRRDIKTDYFSGY
jgi:ferredoxin-NADP reductase